MVIEILGPVGALWDANRTSLFGGIMPLSDPTLKESDLNPDVVNPPENVASLTDASKKSDVEDAEGSHTVDRDFFNAQDGLRGRAGGRYLDVEERAAAEQDRAQREGREPDFDNPPAAAGTTLVTDANRVDNTFSNPSSAEVAPVKEVDPVSTLPVDIGLGTVDQDTTYAEQVTRENQAATTGQEVPTDKQEDSGDETSPSNDTPGQSVFATGASAGTSGNGAGTSGENSTPRGPASV